MDLKSIPETPCELINQSLYLPSFIKRLSDPAIRTIMLCGCGGGFDFVHSMILYPELKRLGKSIVIGSYSFGHPHEIEGDAEIIFREDMVLVKRVKATSISTYPYYAPEINVCSFLDRHYPDEAPHFIYAYHARDFSVPLLSKLYQLLIQMHSVDAIILIDGGSDSLMVGDEDGVGDPVEDAVSVTTVASFDCLKAKILINAGFGTDRYNHVSDASSLRAIAELTAMGGYLGAIALELSNPGFQFYRDCIKHIYEGHGRDGFRSVISGAIISATEGWFGWDKIPPLLENRVKQHMLFVWPLMAVLWAFDIDIVAKRSLISNWIRDKKTPEECVAAVQAGRKTLGYKLRPVENLPRHEEARW
jgi:hypothetical protein